MTRIWTSIKIIILYQRISGIYLINKIHFLRTLSFIINGFVFYKIFENLCWNKIQELKMIDPETSKKC